VIPAAMEGCIYLIDPRSYKQRKSRDGFEYMVSTLPANVASSSSRFLIILRMFSELYLRSGLYRGNEANSHLARDDIR
jgi:hypothetical protein